MKFTVLATLAAASGAAALSEDAQLLLICKSPHLPTHSPE